MMENQSILEDVQSLRLASCLRHHWLCDLYQHADDYSWFPFSQPQPQHCHHRMTSWSDFARVVCRYIPWVIRGTTRRCYDVSLIVPSSGDVHAVCNKGVAHFSHRSDMTHETFELGRGHITFFLSNAFTAASSYVLYKK